MLRILNHPLSPHVVLLYFAFSLRKAPPERIHVLYGTIVLFCPPVDTSIAELKSGSTKQ